MKPANLLTPTPIGTNRPGMHYDGKTRTFSIEASMLDHNGVNPSAVYNDACDLGYTLVSHKTMAHVVVVEVRTILDQDRDVAGWVYESVWPKNMNITMIVYND